MARYTFGGTATDFTFVTYTFGDRQLLQLAPATLTFWDAPLGGSRHTDLLLGGTAVSEIAVGTDGQIPEFQGPDEVTQMWVDAGGAARQLIVSPHGPPGPKGPPGDAGSKWHLTTGVPAGSTGVDTDYALDPDTGAVYYKDGGWTLQGNIAGEDGPQWHTSNGAPSDVTGVDGDFNLDRDTGDYFEKAAGTWGSPLGNLTGPGATIAVGTVTDAAEASFTNVGTPSAAVWDIALPRGNAGVPGPPGPLGFGVEATVSSGTYSLNPAIGTDYTLTVAGDFTLTTSQLGLRQSLYVELIQDSTGGHTVTMPSDWEEIGTVTLSTTPDTIDALVIYRTAVGTFVKQAIAGAPLPSGFWSPEQLADKTYWHNAASLPLEDGETLTGWADEFGLDDMDTVEGAPTMKILNGEKYVRFTSATSDALLSSGPASATQTPLTVVFLARINGPGTQPVMDDGNAFSGLEIYGRDDPQNWGINSSDPNTLAVNGDFQILVANINGASGWARVDGVQQDLNTGGKYITTSGRILGRNQADNANGDVDIAQSFAFGHTPDAQELADIENSLIEKRDTLNGA